MCILELVLGLILQQQQTSGIAQDRHEMAHHKAKLSYDIRDGLLPIVEEEADHPYTNGTPTLKSPSSTSRKPPFSLERTARRFLRALLPSFLGTRASHSDGAKPEQHSSTLYLDGLRGYASICVLNSHVVTAFTNAPQVDWGWNEGENLSPTSLPGIRLLFSGPGMVTLFFLISGFSCSLKPIEAMQHSDPTSQAKVLKNLSGSLMRRWFRLYLPVLCCTALINIWVFFGGFRLMSYYITDESMLHPPERFALAGSTLWQQSMFWFNDMWELLNLWHIWPNGSDAGYYAPFSNPHMWFITVEYKASLILYCVLIALAIARPGARFAALAAGAAYMFFACKDEVLPYFFGACLACVKLEVDRRKSDFKGSGDAVAHLTGLSETVAEFVWNGLLVLSIWLMSTPAWSFQGPSYYALTVITPSAFVRQQTFLQLLGVSGLMLCLMTASASSKLVAFLTHPYALYLGRISFAIYILHGPVLLSIGYAVPIWIWRNFGEGPIGFMLGLIGAEVVTIALSIWLADVFQREIEGRCIKATKWIEKHMTGAR